MYPTKVHSQVRSRRPLRRPRNSARVLAVIQQPDRVCRNCGDHLAKVIVKLVVEGESFRTSMCLSCAAQEVEQKLDLYRGPDGRVFVRTYADEAVEPGPEIELEFIDPDLLDLLVEEDQRLVIN